MIFDFTNYRSFLRSVLTSEFNENEMSRLEQLAGILSDQGVKEVHGSILFESSDRRWESTGPGIGWLDHDLVSCEGAHPRAFNLGLNCATLVVLDPNESFWELEHLDIPVRLELDWGDRVRLRADIDGDGYRIRGTWTDRIEPFRIRLPILDPARFAKGLFEAALKARGIRLVERSGLSRASGRFVATPQAATIYSPPLRELLKPMLKSGAGLIAESLFVTMGGHTAVRDYLDQRLPHERTTSIWDGSGLSRSNLTTTRALHSFLEVLKASPDFKHVWNALPVAGQEGVMAKRMQRTSAEGVLRARAGAHHGFFPLAGYVPKFNGAAQAIDYVPFVMMTQAEPRRRRVARGAQDRAAAELVRLVNY